MLGRGSHRRVLLFVLAATLTVGAPDAFPAPASRAEALAALDDPQTEKRAEGVVWLANHGRIDDQPLLLKRLRDESAFVRGFAEQGLWLLWARSGEAEIDRLMGTGVDQMQAGRHREAVATFSEVIRRKPDFAEGWNKRATVHYLAGDYPRSLADCAEVIKRNPSHFGALSGYGQVYFQLDEYEQAIRWWKRALEINPNMTGVEINIRSTEELLKKKRGRAI
jgi:tetratricopeptide (TPR) repeat protein